MMLKNPTEQEKQLLATIGKGYLKRSPNYEDLSELDWYGYYPVIDSDGIIVGIIPGDGINGIEFEIDQTHDCVWESGIHDNRPNVFLSNPYYDSVEDD